MMNTDCVVIWRDVPVPIKDRHGRRDYGDLPMVNYNPTTQKFEAVVNTRGRAYAARNRMSYRARKDAHGV